MDEIKQKIAEIEAKNRKNNIIYFMAGIAILAIFFSLYFYSAKIKKEKSTQKQLLELQQKNKELELELTKKRQDSLEKFTQQEIKKVKAELSEIKKSTKDSQVIHYISSIYKTVNNIEQIASDSIIVRYYKRKADGAAIENVINSIKTPHYYLHEKEVSNDNGLTKANTIYYGQFVKRAYVDTLFDKLTKNNIRIDNVLPFKQAKGYQWKSSAIEIGYETGTPLGNSSYYIHMYCYKPNEKIKSQIENVLEEKGYQVKAFPNWEEKMPFFSESPTILFYDSTNSGRASEISQMLHTTTRVKFQVKKGEGTGIPDNQRKSLFIIHYTWP
ncbi:hypothetical protein [Abyssalbus ytuae]|uniref:Uncharacterized protein n=1 Tax=Abyssalbus ytuae TaxID=2926907 RepID=A0A9E6ZM92_9FLAO|nr:hypothetical protein [Abyssalbus ytuae]UOB18407.1 hypothetical protein MQE35_03745 [Abyssalbus ytuae]